MLGLDLVKVQLQLAGGATLAELGLAQEGVPQPRGYAIEARINMEAMELDGSVRPAGGLPTAFEPPSAAAHYELDDVIDPADSRRWIASGLRATPPPGSAHREEAAVHRHLVARYRPGQSSCPS